MKRIITCSDGTWDKPGNKHQGIAVAANVEKMFNSICPMGMDKKTGEQVKQLKVYDKGLGTGYSPRDQITGGITKAAQPSGINHISKKWNSAGLRGYMPT